MESKKYKCTLKTITPVLIGAGNDYQYGSNEFIYNKGNLTKSKNNKVIKKIPVVLIKKINVSEFYKSLLDNKDKSEKFLKKLANPEFKLQKYSKTAKKYEIYTSILENEKDKITIIQECIKTLYKPYIPGSSIKGTIRTAILYDKITEEDLKEYVIIDNNKLNDNKYNHLINKYLISDSKNNKTQNNIMRFIQITDSNTTKYPHIHKIESIRITKNEKQGFEKILDTYAETIQTNLNNEITIKKDKNILNRLNLEDKKDILDINYIKKVLFKFSEDYINHEINFTKKYKIDFLTDFYEKLKEKNSEDKPLLRLGSGTGFMGTTINMKIKKENPKLFGKIIQMKNGESIDYPTSRKIIEKSKQPLGWVQISFKEAE